MSAKVWVVGAAGMLGQAVMQALKVHNISATGTGREVDVTQPDILNQYADALRPTHIVNCAAYTDVDGAESEEQAAALLNGEAPGFLASAAVSVGAMCLHVSTDYVFSGKQDRPYEVDHPTGPVGAYGRTKLLGEKSFQKNLGLTGRGRVVRTSWLFGPGGKNFVATMATLFRKHPTVRVVDDQRGRPTYTPDLAMALLRLGGLLTPERPPSGFEICHFANGGETTWYGLAQATLGRLQQSAEAKNLVCEQLIPVSTAEFIRPAFRPPYSVLSTEAYTQLAGDLPRPFASALDDYLRELHPHSFKKDLSCAG